jgi:hypothetical protein
VAARDERWPLITDPELNRDFVVEFVALGAP